MGIETAVSLGLTLFSGMQGMKTAKAQAKAAAAEGAIAADNKAIETARKADAARASFLNSGFDMFGTPESSIAGLYDTGQTDIGRIISNANNKSKSIMSEAKGAFVKSLGTTFAGASMGGFGGSAGGAGVDLGNQMPWLNQTGLGTQMPWLAG